MGGNTSKEATEKAKIKKEKKDREAAINRQRYYEAFEIRQDWNFVFGTEKPKQKKEVLKITDVTPRNVWMIDNYIFEKIKGMQPDELFHPISDYALKWTPPGSAHQMMVPLDDPALQEMVIVKISYIPKKLQKRLIFFFAPRSLNMNMFAPRVHPASLVSYRQRNQVMQKLCAQYLEGRMRVDEFEAIVGGNYEVWKQAMYNMLPEDEQPFHTYLTEKPVEVRTLKMIEADYLADKVPLQDYYDAKFPDRKKRKDLEALRYPRPYPSGQCIICGDPKMGIIKCHVCDNKICAPCIKTTFLDPETREGSFLLMHRHHCLHLPLLRSLHKETVLEPGYLRELRATGWGHAMSILGPLIYAKMHPPEDVEEEEEEVEDEDEARYEAERRRREEEAERIKHLKECPSELERLLHALQNRLKKFEKLKKEIMEHQHNLDEPGHTDQYEARQRRLRDEALEKLAEAVRQPGEVLLRKIVSLDLSESETAYKATEETEELVAKCTFLQEMESVQQYEAKLCEYAEMVEEKRRHKRERMMAEATEAMAKAAKSALGKGKQRRPPEQEHEHEGAGEGGDVLGE